MALNENRYGFTLLEVLIVLGIVAILAASTTLLINPAELLRQSRDYKRVSDLQSINKALDLYSLSGANIFGNSDTVYVSVPSTDPDCNGLGLPNISPKVYKCANETNLRKTDSNGWIPVPFDAIASGSPFTSLPIDPINSVAKGNYYTYMKGSWELTAKMESKKYGPGGTSDTVTTDGGTGDVRLQIGTELDITPAVITGGDGGVATTTSPTFSPVAGTYATTQSVTISSSTSGASIRYTTDESTPTSTIGTLYSGAININTTSTLKAIAYKSGMSDSSVTSGTYTIQVAVGLYWKHNNAGCDGNWSTINCWLTSPSGPTATDVPTSSDDVYFQAGSFNATGQKVTVNATANAKSIDWTGSTNNPTWQSSGGSQTVNISGSLKLISDMSVTCQCFYNFVSTTTGNTVTLAGKSLNTTTFGVAGGSGGYWTLQDTFSNLGTTALTAGTLDTRKDPNDDNSGQTVNTQFFRSNSTNARTLILGNSIINISGSGQAYPCPWQISSGPACNGTSTGMTLISGTSTINFTGTSNTVAGFGNLTGSNAYYNINSTGPNFSIFDANTFNGTVNITGSGRTYLSTNNTYNNFTRIGTGLRGDGIMMNNTQTITGILTLKGNGGGSESSPNRLIIHTNQAGQPKTFTVNTGGSVVLSNVDFKDIGTSGTGWSTITKSDVGDFLDSNGASITNNADSPRTLYWVGNGGNWSDSTHWSTASGATPGNQTPPRPQDTIIFDANSITSAGQTITVDMARPGKNIDFTNVGAANPILSFNTTATIIDNFTLHSGMTMANNSATLTLYSRGMANYTSAGVQWKNPIIVEAVSGTVGGILMKDNFNSTSSVSLIQGILDASDSGANHNMTISAFLSTVGWVPRTVTMGSGTANGGGTWTLTGTGTVWNTVHSGGTSATIINPGLSNIVITNNSSSGKAFTGNAGTATAPVERTYYNLQFTGGGTGALVFNDANRFNNIILGNGGTSPQTVVFPLGLTQTLDNTLSISGGSSPNRITIKSSSAIGTNATISAANAPTTLQYVDVIDINAAPDALTFNCSFSGSCTSASSTGWDSGF